MRSLAAGLVLLAAACSAGTTTGGPAPVNGANGAATPAEPAGEAREGRGRAVMLAPDPHATIVVQREDTVSMELAQGSQVQSFARTTYLTAIAEPSGDEYRMTFVLDSIVSPAGGFLPADSLETARGSRWTARLTPDGRLHDLAQDTIRGRPRSGVSDQTGRMIEVLYPVLPSDGARAGAVWTDSVETRTETSGMEVTERGAVRYEAQPRAGGGLEITGRGTFVLEGSGMQFGQELSMSGSGDRTITYRLGENGRLLGASGTDASILEIIVPAVGQTVPLNQNSTFDVTVTSR